MGKVQNPFVSSSLCRDINKRSPQQSLPSHHFIRSIHLHSLNLPTSKCNSHSSLFWLLPLLLLPAPRERTAAGLISLPASKRMEMIPASATPVISSSLSARTSVLNVPMETAAASSLERSSSVSKCFVKKVLRLSWYLGV